MGSERFGDGLVALSTGPVRGWMSVPGPMPSGTHFLLSTLFQVVVSSRRGPELFETTQLMENVGIGSALNLFYNSLISFIWCLKLL